jgi:predicted alpha/beta superfamily hydrolase
MNGGEDIPELASGLECHFGVDCDEFILLNIQPHDWTDDYSPWPAPGLTGGDKPFGGNAPRYLNFLVDEAKPYMDLHYRTQKDPGSTALIGYSLAGLAALYSLYACTAFGKIASVSGSLWYEGWSAFMESHAPLNPCARVYLSLGKGECRSRNQKIASVGECTLKAEEILAHSLTWKENLLFEWNDGGHFSGIPGRLQKAILWLMQA